jgi:hypothetical protein
MKCNLGVGDGKQINIWEDACVPLSENGKKITPKR